MEAAKFFVLAGLAVLNIERTIEFVVWMWCGHYGCGQFRSRLGTFYPTDALAQIQNKSHG